MSFENLNLDPTLLRAIESSGYTEPTEVQSKAIPAVAEKQDAIVLAQTGTGKTAAYVLPILQKLLGESEEQRSFKKSPRVLILLPTRELAQQVHQACRTYGKYIPDLRVALVTGGVPFFQHKKRICAKLDILIATPGRVLDYLETNKLKGGKVDFLVLDEADRMLDMGFSQDVKKIISYLPKQRQTLLFSATMNPGVESLAKDLTDQAVTIKTSNLDTKNENIEQKIQYVGNLVEKSLALKKIVSDEKISQSIIFTGTKSAADQLAGQLTRGGFKADALHGDMRQSVRTKILQKFKNKELQFLVGTDVLGRGIDVPSVSHVINYDMPNEPEDYVHRIGRTGRASAKGSAITLAYHKEFVQHRRIEKYLGYKIEELGLEGISAAPQGKANSRRRRVGGPRGASGGRRYAGRSRRRSARR